jgi:hypothetical protein
MPQTDDRNIDRVCGYDVCDWLNDEMKIDGSPHNLGPENSMLRPPTAKDAVGKVVDIHNSGRSLKLRQPKSISVNKKIRPIESGGWSKVASPPKRLRTIHYAGLGRQVSADTHENNREPGMERRRERHPTGLRSPVLPLFSNIWPTLSTRHRHWRWTSDIGRFSR